MNKHDYSSSNVTGPYDVLALGPFQDVHVKDVSLKVALQYLKSFKEAFDENGTPWYDTVRLYHNGRTIGIHKRSHFDHEQGVYVWSVYRRKY